MLATLLAVFAFQQATVTVTAGNEKSGVRVHVTDTDSTAQRDSTKKKPKKFISATPAQIESAYPDGATRTFVARARAARLAQDSTIISYEASTLQRLTIGVGISKFGRDRTLFRNEASSRVRWSRSVGAQIDVTGRRSAAPMIGGVTDVDIEGALSPIPYYPGRDALWLGMGVVKETEEDDDVINPLSKDAEAFYTYHTGDSISFRLPGGTTIQLREIEVRPRKADPRAIVGSFWFDATSAQLIRAAFRMSKPADLIENSDGDKPSLFARAFIPHVTASIEGVAIEYGLYQGRFWLPRSEVIEGRMTAGFARMGMSIEERFTYASVNALDTMPIMRARYTPIKAPPTPAGTDTATAARLKRQYVDSVVAAREKAECDATGKRSVRTDRYKGVLPLMVLIPCDTAKLSHSLELPGSIYDTKDEVFSDAERDELLARAKSMMPPLPMYGLPHPTVEYGPDMQRYNRVEGLSLAAGISQQVALGTTVSFTPRIGTADRVFNAELAVSRLNGNGMRQLSVYRRLNASNDWGHPLSFGAGASAFLFGRDEGFYYRSTGAELSGDYVLGHSLDWRLFTEKQSDAVSRTNVSVPQLFGSSGFGPEWNIAASRIRESGASVRQVSSFGMDPNGFRLMSDVRLEGAGGDQDYGRGALDVTVSHGIGFILDRFFSAAVTAGAGTSVGELPVQRLWYLGGTNSVRGQPAGAMSGSSYWLTRTEVGYGPPSFRRAAFFDLGWAGDRTKWSEMGRPASGVGVGWSFLDGLVRMDVARGLFPTKQIHTALYLDARF
jgi:hypothetical protein